MKDWVDSCLQLLPETASIIHKQKIRVESSRKESVLASDPTKGKFSVFSSVVSSLNLECTSRLNLIVIGDQEPEFEAGRKIQETLGSGKCLLKIVQFAKKRPEELSKEQSRLTKEFNCIYWRDHDEHLTFCH